WPDIWTPLSTDKSNTGVERPTHPAAWTDRRSERELDSDLIRRVVVADAPRRDVVPAEVFDTVRRAGELAVGSPGHRVALGVRSTDDVTAQVAVRDRRTEFLVFQWRETTGRLVEARREIVQLVAGLE